MERVLTDTAATVSQQFYEDGAAVDPSTVTIGITREDGTTLVAAGTATGGTGTAARTFALTTTHTASLDTLTLTWTSTTKGVLTQAVEVVGGFLFSLAQARSDSELSSTSRYSTADLIEARVIAERNLEQACGVAFAPRYFREKVDGSGGDDVLLQARPLSITSVVYGATSSSDGTTLTADELEDLRLYNDGRLYNPNGWTRGRQNVEVKGTHGYEVTPPLAMQGALALAKDWLVNTPYDQRTASITHDDGSTQLLKADGTFGVVPADKCVAVLGVNHGIG